MTWIKKIEMQGFKSFANKTVISFDRNLSVIVGPNGSGKSNIVDALFFVLGKTSKKDMRARKLGELVFNGGKGGKPSSEARVDLILDNEDGSIAGFNDKEVRISRRVDKKGNSDYRLNGKRVTKAEIDSFLRNINIDPEGFNIIKQGEIARFVEMHPEERADIIKEIAGISVFENKKEKALKELQKVQDKVKELNIVLKEKEKQLQSLLEDKKTAEKYLKLKNKVIYSEAQVLNKKLEISKKKFDEITSNINKLNSEIDRLNSEINKLNETEKEKESEIKELSKKIENEGEKESKKIENEIKELRINIESKEDLIRAYKEQLERLKEKKENTKKERIENEKKQKELKKIISIKKEKLKTLKEVIEKKEEFLEENKSGEHFFVLQRESLSIEEEIVKLENKLEKAIENKKLLKKKSLLEKEFLLYDKKLKLINKKSSQQRELKKEILKKQEEVEKYLNYLITEKTKIEERIKIKQAFREEGIKEILKLKKNPGIGHKIYGTFAELITVPGEYAYAFKELAGENLKTIVVEDKKTALICVDYLLKNRFGKVRFLPLKELTEIKIHERNNKINGEKAINLIKYDKKFEKAIKWLFGNSLIVDDINKIPLNEIAVDKKGVVVKNNLIIGGSETSRTGFKEEDNEKKLLELNKNLEDYKSYKIKLKNEENKITGIINSILNEQSEIKNNLNLIKTQLKEIEKKIDVDFPKEEDIRKKLNKLKEDKKKIELILSSTKKTISEDEIKELERELKTLKNKYQEMVLDIKTKEAELTQVLMSENKRIINILNQLDKQEKGFKIDIKQMEEYVKDSKKLLKEKIEYEKKFFSNIKKLDKRRKKLKQELEKIRISLMKNKGMIERKEEIINELKIKKSEVIGEIAGLKERLKEFSHIEIKNTRKTLKELCEEEARLRREIANYGAVNMKALDTYMHVKSDFEVLKEKSEELEKEKEEVLNLISQIEGKKKFVFLNTLKDVNKKFNESFSYLSPEGEARLTLETPENPLEGGLEIIARPAGKKMSSLSLLSGGEKTLVTIAFLFAIQDYKLAPFYVVDEIDAALDKTNSEKLAMRIREYSKKTQFIVISHNDEIIMMTDKLYGVSCNDKKISQIVSIKLDDIGKYKEDNN